MGRGLEEIEPRPRAKVTFDSMQKTRSEEVGPHIAGTASLSGVDGSLCNAHHVWAVMAPDFFSAGDHDEMRRWRLDCHTASTRLDIVETRACMRCPLSGVVWSWSGLEDDSHGVRSL